MRTLTDISKQILYEISGAVVTLYHGSHSGFDPNLPFHFSKYSHYQYLTDNYNYALYYARGNKTHVMNVQIDFNNFLDLRKFDVIKYDFKDLQKQFYKYTGLYFPAELKFFSNSIKRTLWYIIRSDNNTGYLQKYLLNNHFNGIIMYESNSQMGGTYKSFVLLNNSPVIKKWI